MKVELCGLGIACVALLLTSTSTLPASPGSNLKTANPHVLQVGWGKKYLFPSVAAQFARDGDTVEIDAGDYDGDVAVWKQNNLTIRAVGGRAHIRAAGKSAQGKAIWVVKGNNVTVENIEFSGAEVSDGNGAGIRIEGQGITIRNCYFHDNQDGILGGAGKESDIVIENSEFARNGAGDGQSHNIYIGAARSFTLKFSYSHHARVGHNVKSRAQKNFILYNRIMDEKTGNSSYDIDLPNGGLAYIIGNLIQQGPDTENATIISYGAEGLKNPDNELYVVNNTIVNDRPQGGKFLFVKPGAAKVEIINNLFVGKGNLPSIASVGGLPGGPWKMAHNLTLNESELKDAPDFDYRLKPGSQAIDAGIDPGTANGFNLTPEWEYVHKMRGKRRPLVGPLDVGAYEYVGARKR